MDGRRKGMPRRPRFSLLGLMLLVWLAAASGCEAIPWDALPAELRPNPPTPVLSETPGGTETGATEPPVLENGEETPVPSEVPTLEEGHDNVLRVWVPPQFDPDAQTPSGQLLRERLESFAARYPAIRLEVRVKAEEGPGGLLAALSTASVSAPLTLPDVVALPRPFLETAALKGVIFQMDDLPVAEVGGFLTESDWYPYAVQMGRLQGNTFGLPFASDMLVMVAHPEPAAGDGQEGEGGTPEPTATATPEPDQDALYPPVWGRLFESGETLAFPGADPQALFTLLLYRSIGGPWTDGDGRPALDPALLEQVLALYQQASQAEVLPYWLSQYETGEQVWEAFRNGEAERAVVWASQALADWQAEDPLALEGVPTLDGEVHTLATGWVWAVASPDPDSRFLAGELAAFLVEPGFLAAWNAAAGMVPPRAAAMGAWAPTDWREVAGELSTSAELLPPGDVLPVLGPPLRQATVDVLKLVAEPAVAAQEAAAAVGEP